MKREQAYCHFATQPACAMLGAAERYSSNTTCFAARLTTNSGLSVCSAQAGASIAHVKRFLVLSILLVISNAFASANAAMTIVVRPGTAPQIDGKLNDACWASAPKLRPFLTLKKGDPAKPATTTMIACDAKNLYFGFICEEPKINALKHTETKRDGDVFMDDCIEIFLATRKTPSPYYHFVVNCLGIQRDDIGADSSWDAIWSAKTVIEKTRWTVEVAIPFSSIPITAESNGPWRVNFARENYASGGLSSWMLLESTFHEPERFGFLSIQGVDLLPFAEKTVNREAEVISSRIVGFRSKLKPIPSSPLVKEIIAKVDKLAKAVAYASTAAQRAQSMEALRKAEQQLAAIRKALPAQATQINIASALSALPKKLQTAGYLVCQESTMIKLVRGKPYTPKPTREFKLALAKGEAEAVQVVVLPVEGDLLGVKLEVTNLNGPKGILFPKEKVTVNVVGYVNIKRPSGGAKMGIGPFPDPLLDNAPVNISKGDHASFWVTFTTPEELSAGQYRGELVIRPENAQEVRLPLVLKVWDFVLPKRSFLRSCYLLSPSTITRMHQFPGWLFGTWTGADMRGIKNYFGSGEFSREIITTEAKDGSRCIKISARNLRRGKYEGPRACFQTNPIPLEPNKEYEFSFWYRTSPGAKGCAGFYLPHVTTTMLAPTTEWRRYTRRFNSGQNKETRVYLGAYAEGDAYYDGVVLRKLPDSENLLENSSFETGSFANPAELIRKYRLNALRHRASTANIAAPRIKVTADGRTAKLDWKEFDREVEFYLKHGQNAFNIYWTRLPRGWGKVEEVKDEKRLALCRDLLRKTQNHLEQKGWIDLGYIYAIDEPGRTAFPGVKAAFQLVREAAPKLKTLLTFGYGATRPWKPGAKGRPAYAELAPFVNIFVPHSDCFDPAFLETQRNGNNEVWAYVCISAQHPYVNMWAIDYPGWENRVLFWQFFRYRIEGFLYWQITYWQKNPWQNPMTYPGGNGDGSLVYPGKEGPVNSIRWEILRDGTEDYDMLTMLRRAREKVNPELRTQIDKVLNIDDVTRSFTEYLDSPDAIEAHRSAVGALLEKIYKNL